MFRVESPRDVRSVLSIGLTNDIRSPAKDPRLPGNRQRDGHAAESRKMIVNNSHSTKQAKENHGKEGVRYRDRHQKETMEAPRHRPRSDDHRSDPRRHGNRDSRERDRNHRNHHRQEQRNGAPVESKSNHTQREHARYHSSHRNLDRNCDRDYDHRDRYHDRDRDCERTEGSACQERQMEPGQNRMRLDTRFPSTITTFDENEVCNETEVHCSNSLEIDTQDPHFISLLEYNRAHNPEYFLKLQQQEGQSSKSVASPVENGWSPAEYEITSAEMELSPPETTAESPYETTSSRVSYPKVQPRVETTVTRVPNSGVSRRNEATVARASNPKVQPVVTTTVSGASNAVASTRVEKAVSQSPNPRVSDTLNPFPTGITPHRSSTYSSAAPLPSTSNATNRNALSGRTSAASSFSLSSGPDISQPSTSSGGNRSLDRRESRSELSPDAQIVSDIVRQRNPPAKCTQLIPILWKDHEGSRKRKAHADTEDVTPLRKRGTSGGGSAPSRISAKGAPKNTIQKQMKKYAETLRGRKNWK